MAFVSLAQRGRRGRRRAGHGCRRLREAGLAQAVAGSRAATGFHDALRVGLAESAEGPRARSPCGAAPGCGDGRLGPRRGPRRHR